MLISCKDTYFFIHIIIFNRKKHSLPRKTFQHATKEKRWWNYPRTLSKASRRRLEESQKARRSMGRGYLQNGIMHLSFHIYGCRAFLMTNGKIHVKPSRQFFSY